MFALRPNHTPPSEKFAMEDARTESRLRLGERSAARPQTFRTLDVSQDAIVYRAFTATGRELKGFHLTKGSDGIVGVNELEPANPRL